ncbi:MAG: MBL fold metallo-hydrolase [Candidatus Niyogibacteria bacterium CG10_big_fil_rev_8_21_14_0_10_42_19]|uniref:MBL fold metallo-hydrolase n=1 Tax=Candidatus Niyogibacteria bacterium CG10_big_fil_rev_8_21_14_0_10_42_19 TaxID=1974725 RepID=A0A2H0TI45_9BACT|nr:MAG: MBL fold metallo-hydrolase [Candidatus Niyogibacteria bacterium CG10_big_fil_rev_8_21_14_0_10_42_19]
MRDLKKNIGIYSLLVLLSIAVFVWGVVFYVERDYLTVAFLDIGQGDAIFIEAPNGNQILIDAGPNKKILSEISKLMPFYDRFIDVVIATHPDADHIGGLPDIFKRYKVGIVIDPGTISETTIYKEFEKLIDEKGLERLKARRGMRLTLGENIYLIFMFPDENIFGNKNDSSIVTKLVYGDSSFLFMGDAERRTEQYLYTLDKEALDADILKVGHHGSKTSTSDIFLEAVSPDIAIIQVGEKNRYGHPHDVVLKKLQAAGASVLRTDIDGSVIFHSDGINLWEVSR